MSERDLKLNSLSRFSKQSSRFVLEEYSHCEVPAGCGGVVLRWQKPEVPIPMTMRDFAPNGTSRNRTLNGSENLYSSKIPVSYGKHVLAIEINDFKPEYAVIFMYCQLDEDYVRILKPYGDTNILSLPDGTWRYTLDSPDPKWQEPDFDDSGWHSLVEKPTYADPRYGDISSSTQRLVDKGAVPLGIDIENPNILEQLKHLLTSENVIPKLFIRKTFTIIEYVESDEEKG